MSAKIYKIDHTPTDPDLLLEMIRSNFDNIESVIVSVSTDQFQFTYHSQMTKADMAFHLVHLQEDLISIIRNAPIEEDS